MSKVLLGELTFRTLRPTSLEISLSLFDRVLYFLLVVVIGEGNTSGSITICITILLCPDTNILKSSRDKTTWKLILVVGNMFIIVRDLHKLVGEETISYLSI